MLIHLKACYSISGKIPARERVVFSFVVPLENKSDVLVEIKPGEKSAESMQEVEVSGRLHQVLLGDVHDAKNLPEDLQQELTQVTRGVSIATTKVLSLIKYCLYSSRLSENLFAVKEYYWSVDRSNWKRMPMAIFATLQVQHIEPLDDNTTHIIQQYIENDFEPFLALRHLYRSREERDPRYKWIDATIAAELAIKEFLIKKCPAMERILLEVQAPALDKLYGSILKDCANEESPNKKAIKNGADIRNALIHKPLKIEIGAQDAISYYSEIQMAIFHLLNLLYPKDPLIRRFFESSKLNRDKNIVRKMESIRQSIK